MSAKTGVLRAVYSTIALLVRLVWRFVLNFSVYITLGVSVYKAGQFSKASLEHQKEVLDLLYWRDPKKSGVALGLTLTLLIAFATMSVISVLAYTGILVLTAAVSLKVAQIGLAKLGKDTAQVEQVQHMISNSATELPADKVHKQVDVLLEHLNHSLGVMRRMILVEDVVETIKFGLFLWALTYVGQWFSGITLVIIAVLAAFSVPKVYELYKEPIDQYLGIAHGYIQKFDDTVQQNVPFLKRKQQ